MDPRKEIEVDPDLEPAKCSGSGWIRIRNADFNISLTDTKMVAAAAGGSHGRGGGVGDPGGRHKEND